MGSMREFGVEKSLDADGRAGGGGGGRSRGAEEREGV